MAERAGTDLAYRRETTEGILLIYVNTWRESVERIEPVMPQDKRQGAKIEI